MSKSRQLVGGGEIDTSAPFASVKAAVSLFGEIRHSAEKLTLQRSKPPVLEKGVSKETKLHLAKKELKKYKEHLQNAQATKAQALSELEKARETVNDLTNALSNTNKSKESAIHATEEARFHAKELEAATPRSPMTCETPRQTEWANARERYSSAMADLDEAKRELRKMRREFSSIMDAKSSAIQHETEATQIIEANRDHAHHLAKEIAAACDCIMQVKQAYVQILEEHGDIEKHAEESSCKEDEEKTQLKLQSLREEMGTNGDGDLEGKLSATMDEVRTLQALLDSAKSKSSQSNSLTDVATDLAEAKGTLYKALEEEHAQRDLLESLKLEFEHVKKEHQELREKEAEAELVVEELHAKIRCAKAELDAATASEAKSRAASDELVSTVKELAVECEEARVEARKMREEAESLKKEAETARVALKNAESLKVVLREADDAKEAESSALHQNNMLSGKMNVVRASASEPGTDIAISTQEYESLSRKANDAAVVAGMKESAAKALVEAIRMSEKESMKKLESIRKEIENLKTATAEALKKAEMAEAAKTAVEEEMEKKRRRDMRRWSSAELPSLPSVNQKEYDFGRLSDAGPATTKAIDVCCRQKMVKSCREVEVSSMFEKKMQSSFTHRRRKNPAAGGLPPFAGGRTT